MMCLFKQAAAVLLCLLSAWPAFAIERETDDVILRHFLWDKFTALPKNERPKIGVALSAGGVRGFAHVGVLEALNNAQVPVDMISGTYGFGGRVSLCGRTPDRKTMDNRRAYDNGQNNVRLQRNRPLSLIIRQTAAHFFQPG